MKCSILNNKIVIALVFIISVYNVSFSQQDINVPESGDFGNVALNTPKDYTVTIENTYTGGGGPSTTSLEVTDIIVSGTNASEFVVSGIVFPTDIGKGSSTTFIITFTPTASGNRTASLSITSDDPDENPYDLNLSGFGDASLTYLTLLNTYPLTVLEPSGLAFNKADNTLFTVSDNTGDVHIISIAGVTQQTLNYSGADLEGVSMYTSNKILIAVEGTRELIEYDYDADIASSFTSHTMNYSNQSSDSNSLIEGVSYDAINDVVYFLSEKNPGSLNVADGSFNVTNQFMDPLSHGGDYSGICYVEETGHLWIASDQTSTVYKCSTNGNIEDSFLLETNAGATLDKFEGIAIDYPSQLLYAIADGGQELYVYKIFDPSFTLGIDDEFISENNIQIYPIPAKNSLNISLKNYEAVEKVTIYSIQGQLVTQFYSIEKELDISSLNSGMYFLEIITEATKYVKTIAVTK